MNGGVVEATSNIEKANEKNPSSANASVKIGSSWNHNGNFAPLKIYGCKIYEAGVLVRNFRPCIVDGVVGLRDSLTGLFVSYPPSKSRTDVNRLEYGGAISVFGADSVPYIESAGLDGQFILTDYKPCGATRAEIDFEQLYVTKRKFLFGVHATGTEFAFALYAMDTTRTYGYCCQDDDPNWTYEGMPAWTFLRTTLILDAKNRNYAKAESRAAVTNWITGIWTTPSPEKRSQYNLPIFASRQRVSVGGVDLLDDYETASSGYWTGYMPMRLYGFRIYEDDTLVRDYVPTNRDGVVGLQNVLPGGNFLTTWTSPSGVTGPDFVYGTSSTNAPAVIPAAVRLPYRKSVTLMASMPNALSYRWVKNGEYIPGETEAALTIDWECSGVSDVYRVMAIYPVGVDDLTVSSGLSNPIPVEHLSAGLMTIFK